MKLRFSRWDGSAWVHSQDIGAPHTNGEVIYQSSPYPNGGMAPAGAGFANAGVEIPVNVTGDFGSTGVLWTQATGNWANARIDQPEVFAADEAGCYTVAHEVTTHYYGPFIPTFPDKYGATGGITHLYCAYYSPSGAYDGPYVETSHSAFVTDEGAITRFRLYNESGPMCDPFPQATILDDAATFMESGYTLLRGFEPLGGGPEYGAGGGLGFVGGSYGYGARVQSVFADRKSNGRPLVLYTESFPTYVPWGTSLGAPVVPTLVLVRYDGAGGFDEIWRQDFTPYQPQPSLARWDEQHRMSLFLGADALPTDENSVVYQVVGEGGQASRTFTPADFGGTDTYLGLTASEISSVPNANGDYYHCFATVVNAGGLSPQTSLSEYVPSTGEIRTYYTSQDGSFYPIPSQTLLSVNAGTTGITYPQDPAGVGTWPIAPPSAKASVYTTYQTYTAANYTAQPITDFDFVDGLLSARIPGMVSPDGLLIVTEASGGHVEGPASPGMGFAYWSPGSPSVRAETQALVWNQDALRVGARIQTDGSMAGYWVQISPDSHMKLIKRTGSGETVLLDVTSASVLDHTSFINLLTVRVFEDDLGTRIEGWMNQDMIAYTYDPGSIYASGHPGFAVTSHAGATAQAKIDQFAGGPLLGQLINNEASVYWFGDWPSGDLRNYDTECGYPHAWLDATSTQMHNSGNVGLIQACGQSQCGYAIVLGGYYRSGNTIYAGGFFGAFAKTSIAALSAVCPAVPPGYPTPAIYPGELPPGSAVSGLAHHTVTIRKAE